MQLSGLSPDSSQKTLHSNSNSIKILHGKCARTVFTHALWRIRIEVSVAKESNF